VGAVILPVLADEMLVSVPWLSAAAVQSVIQVSAALILIAEALNLIDLLRSHPTERGGSLLTDDLH